MLWFSTWLIAFFFYLGNYVTLHFIPHVPLPFRKFRRSVLIEYGILSFIKSMISGLTLFMHESFYLFFFHERVSFFFSQSCGFLWSFASREWAIRFSLEMVCLNRARLYFNLARCELETKCGFCTLREPHHLLWYKYEEKKRARTINRRRLDKHYRVPPSVTVSSWSLRAVEGEGAGEIAPECTERIA